MWYDHSTLNISGDLILGTTEKNLQFFQIFESVKTCTTEKSIIRLKYYFSVQSLNERISGEFLR